MDLRPYLCNLPLPLQRVALLGPNVHVAAMIAARLINLSRSRVTAAATSAAGVALGVTTMLSSPQQIASASALDQTLCVNTVRALLAVGETVI